MIKAIETRYKGYRFRSRLEARWAVFFDKMGWDWRYEHQGYRIGQDGTAWLPDFEVTVNTTYFQYNFYVEVKGDRGAFSDGRFVADLDFGNGPPGHQDSHNHVWTGKWGCGLDDERRPIMLLGDIPKEKFGVLFLPLITHGKGVSLIWVALDSDGFETQAAQMLFELNHRDKQTLRSIPGVEDFQPVIVETQKAYRGVMDALSAARSARFEHGEAPA